MRNDFCSNYLAHAKGVEWKNHKYVAKLKLANGKFFYFYSQAQYDSYMNKMKKRNDANREALNEKFGIKKATPKVEAKKNTTVEDSKSKSKKKSGSSSSSKSSGAKSGKSSSSSKSKSSSEEKAKKGSGSSKQAKESTKKTSAKSSANAMTMSKLLRELEAATAVTTKGEETNAAKLKETYGVIDNEVSSLNAMKAEQEMNQKYKDGAYGFISVGDKVYKWDKQGGQMHLYDFQSEKEIPFNTIIKGQKQLISEFSIDDKKDRKKTLAHHGILGMKWGRKNGPPYPLGEEDHSAREKKAGYKKSLGSGRNEELYGKSSNTTKESKSKEKNQFHLTEGQKRAIKIGAAVAATALIAYGGYKLTRNPKVRELIAKGMQGSKATRMANIEKAIQNSGPEIVKKAGDAKGTAPKLNELPKTSKLYNALSNTNPSGRMDNCKELATSNACKALGKNVAVDANRFEGNIKEMFDQKYGLGSIVKPMTPQSSNADEIKAQVERYILRKNKEGSVGVISIDYSKQYIARVKEELGVDIQGHAFNYVVENGKVTFACGQSNYPKDMSGIFKHINSEKEILIAEITEEVADIMSKHS